MRNFLPYIHIGISVVVGACIIFLAFYMSQHKDVSHATPAITVDQTVSGTARKNIKITDTDEDGIADWEESFTMPINIPSSTVTTTEDSVSAYIPPTTFTGKFAEAFFSDYFDGKMNGKNMSTSTVFIDNALSSISSYSQSKTHSRVEIDTVEANQESVRAYGNEIIAISNKYSQGIDPNFDEFTLIKEAFKKNEINTLQRLEPLALAYNNTIIDTRDMSVPSTLVSAHINLLNAYEALYADLNAIQHAETDPLYALARVRSYPDDLKLLANTLKSIRSLLNLYNVHYAENEPGAALYLFEE